MDWLVIGIIAVLAMIPRLLLLFSLPPLLHLDSDSYFEIAQRLWSGAGFGDLSRRTPLYPLLISIVGHSRRAGLFPVILLQHLLGVIGAILLYLIARRLFPLKRVIAAAAGLAGGLIVYPALVEQSILSESLYGLFLLAAVYLLFIWFQENKSWAALGCGVLLGLASLTRPVAGGVFPVWAGLLFLLLDSRKAARFLLLCGSAFLLLVSPLLLRNYRVMGTLALDQSIGRNLISVTDRLVDYDHGIYLPIKSIYREFLKDKRGPDAVIVFSAMPQLRRMTHWTDAQIDRALAAIAWEAIRAHPLDYLAGRWRRFPLLFRDPAESQEYALHAETYLPLLEFVGQFDPELVKRSLAVPGLNRIRFGLAEKVYDVFALDLTSGWLMFFSLLGVAGIIFLERRQEGWLLLALPGYACITAVLLQPPNARYRIPTLPFEVLCAIAGYYFAGVMLWSLVKRASDRVVASGFATSLLRRANTSRKLPRIFSSGRQPLFSAAGIFVLICSVFLFRALLGIQAATVFNLDDWKRNWDKHDAGAGDNQPLRFRELSIAGRNIAVLYGSGAAASVGQTISADIPVIGGFRYRLQTAHSCQTAACAGALLRVTALDERGSIAASSAFNDSAWSRRLSQERTDNDLFWDQLTLRFSPPPTARTLRLELTIRGGNGQGSLVIPYLSLTGQPTLFNAWRSGTRGVLIFGIPWLCLLGIVFYVCR